MECKSHRDYMDKEYSIPVLEEEVKEDLLDMIKRYSPIGIVLVGSYSMPYRDKESDYDFEIIVNDSEYYSIEENGDLLIKHESTVRPIEYLFRSRSEFLNKINASNDIEHWPYQGGCIIYDENCFMRDTIAQIMSIDKKNFQNRAKIHYFEFLFFLKRLKRICQIENAYNYGISFNCAYISIIRLLFVIEGEWPPAMHWAYQNVCLLGDKAKEIVDLLLQVERRFSEDKIDAIISKVDKYLFERNFSFQIDKNSLTAEVCSEKMLDARSRYSLL